MVFIILKKCTFDCILTGSDGGLLPASREYNITHE